MPFLTTEELSSHLYGEVVNEIQRGQSGPAAQAIAAAIAEARGYLTQYNLQAIFAATGDDRNPILLLYVKDIAVWHFIQLANPGVEMQLRLDRYEKAIEWLVRVQKGQTNPDLPLPAPAVDGLGNAIPSEDRLKWGGNAKRRNYFN